MAKQSKISELRFPVGGLHRAAGFDQTPPYCTPYAINVRPFDHVNLASANLHGYRQRGGSRPGQVKVDPTQIEDGPIQLLDFASKLGTDGVSSNYLLAVADGVLWHNADGTMDDDATGVEIDGTGTLNASAKSFRGTQVGDKYYIADFRPVNLTSQTGTIAVGVQLSDALLTNEVLNGIDTDRDVVWISGSVPLESNIFPISSITQGSPGFLTISGGSVTSEVGTVTWQLGRITKVFDPKALTLTNLAPTLPIPASHYSTGTVVITSGEVRLTAGDWTDVPDPVTSGKIVTIEIPNLSQIGTRTYRIILKNSASFMQLADTTGESDSPSTTYTISWESEFYGIPPLNCNLCCTYRGRLVLAGPGAVWYMSRVLNPSDWDYGYDRNDPSRAIAGTSTTTGGIPEPITALIPHSDDYLIFGCEHSLWILTSDPAFGGNIQALSRDVGVLGADAWCNLPDGSLVIMSRDGLYQIPAGGQSYPQSISRDKLPAELLNVDWVNNYISMCYDIESRGIHLSITPIGGTVGTHYWIDWTTRSFWPVTLPDAKQTTAMVKYSPNSAIPSTVILGGYDGYLRKYQNQNFSGTGSWVQGTGGTPKGVLTDSTMAWTVDALKGQYFIIGTTTLECDSNTATTATMTTAGPVDSASVTWEMKATDDGTAFDSLAVYGPFRVAGPGRIGEILQISADLDLNGKDVNYGIFGGDSAQAAVQAAVNAGSTATAPWSGTLSATSNHRQYPRATGAALAIMVEGDVGYGWAIEGMRVETKDKGPIR
jgi:hypothetical protein